MAQTKRNDYRQCKSGAFEPNVPKPAGPIDSSKSGSKAGSKNKSLTNARVKELTAAAKEPKKQDDPEDQDIKKVSAELYSLQVKHADLALKCTMLDIEMSALQSRHDDLELKHETLAAELKALRIFFELTIQPGSICVKSAAEDLETLGEAFTNHSHDGHGRPPVLPAAMFRKGSIRTQSGNGS